MLEPGDKIVDCPPTFTMYEFDAAVNNALVLKGKFPLLDVFNCLMLFLHVFDDIMLNTFHASLYMIVKVRYQCDS